MSKKVDVSFMKFVYTDAEWTREIVEGGDKQLCSECTLTRRRNFWTPKAPAAGAALLEFPGSSLTTFLLT